MLLLVERLAILRDVSPSTLRAWRTAVASLTRWAGPVKPQEAADRLSEFVAHRSAYGSPYTAAFYRRTLLGLLRQAEDLGLCRLPRRVRAVRLPEHSPLGFTDQEIKVLLCFASPIQRAAILLVRYGALRRGDVFRVTWRQVGADGVLRLVMGKSGRRHSVRLPEDVLAACDAVRLTEDDRLVPWRLTFSSWAKGWKRLGVRSGVDTTNRGLQAIRRVAASLVAREYGEVEAARLLGHANGSGVNVFRAFYRVGEICDRPPPSPPPLG